MKQNFLKVTPLLALVLIFGTACQKTSNVSSAIPQTATTPQQQTMLLSATNAVTSSADVEDETNTEMITDGLGAPGDTSCRTVTYLPSKKVFPHQTIINFGNGCLGADGVIRKGIKTITVYVNPDSAAVGAELSLTTFNNFYQDSLSVQGEIKIYKEANTAAGLPVAQHVENITLSSPNGSTKSSYGTTYWTQTTGDSTKTHQDNAFSITGSSSGTETLDGATALTFKTTIDPLNPVVKVVDCYYRSQGDINVIINLITGGAATFNENLNYGNGACDNIATLSLNGGTPQQITLPLDFWPLSL